jgi:hypothetical protein
MGPALTELQRGWGAEESEAHFRTGPFEATGFYIDLQEGAELAEIGRYYVSDNESVIVEIALKSH